MNNYFKFDFVNKTIVGTKTSIAKANRGYGREYEELCDKLSKQPTFAVRPKDIDIKEDKKTYNDLTFKRMEEYIKLQDNSEDRLIEFEAIKKVAEAKGAKYPLTKKWFLKAYPEFKTSNFGTLDTAKVIAREELEKEKREKEKAALKEAEAALDNITEFETDDDEIEERLTA